MEEKQTMVRALQSHVREIREAQRESMERMKSSFTLYDDELVKKQETLHAIIAKMASNMETDRQKLAEAYEKYERHVDKMHNDVINVYENFYQFILNGMYDKDIRYVAQLFEKVMTSPHRSQYNALVRELMLQLEAEAGKSKMEGRVSLRLELKEDKSQYVFGKEPLYFDFW